MSRKTVLDQNHEEDFLVSFRYLDPTQGQTLCEWEQAGILARGIDVLKNYCCAPLNNQIDGDRFAKYDDFPPKDKTDFIHPKHVPEDASWARIHVNGTQVIAGFVNRNIFNVVFLDREHRFWITEKKHT